MFLPCELFKILSTVSITKADIKLYYYDISSDFILPFLTSVHTNSHVCMINPTAVGARTHGHTREWGSWSVRRESTHWTRTCVWHCAQHGTCVRLSVVFERTPETLRGHSRTRTCQEDATQADAIIMTRNDWRKVVGFITGHWSDDLLWAYHTLHGNTHENTPM